MNNVNISAIAKEFKDHEGISDSKISNWIKQFDPAHKNIALKILLNVN